MRGDSGLSDSQYIKCQKYIQNKNKKQISEIENQIKLATLEKRFKNQQKKDGGILAFFVDFFKKK